MMTKNSNNKIADGTEAVDDAVTKTAAMFESKPKKSTADKKIKK